MPEAAGAVGALLRGLVDYAGLFPPAARTMAETVERYARYRIGRDAAMLGRLVVPAARLTEWGEAVTALPAALRGRECWRLTALVSLPASRDLESIAAFNDGASSGRDFQGRVDSIEVKVASPDEVRRVASEVPAGLDVFYECVAGDGLSSLLAEIRSVGGGAKIRTGGLVPEAIAAPEAVAAFVAACMAAPLPFKATAGLHHPVRASFPLTYEPDAPRAVMNGFLNVFVGAVLAHARGLDAGSLLPIIAETSPRSFVFTDSHLAWRDLSATADQVIAARQFARGFGSCSFEEPVAELKAMGACL